MRLHALRLGVDGHHSLESTVAELIDENTPDLALSDRADNADATWAKERVSPVHEGAFRANWETP